MCQTHAKLFTFIISFNPHNPSPEFTDEETEAQGRETTLSPVPQLTESRFKSPPGAIF